jgi:hypothetical protein
VSLSLSSFFNPIAPTDPSQHSRDGTKASDNPAAIVHWLPQIYTFSHPQNNGWGIKISSHSHPTNLERLKIISANWRS